MLKRTSRAGMLLAAAVAVSLTSAAVLVTAAAPPTPASPPATGPADRAAPPPSQTEIGEDFDAGRYDAVLRKVRVALELEGPAAKAYDRAALLRTRGEALLRTKQGGAAARAFEDVADEAEDKTGRAEALATALLIRRSNAGLLYVGRRSGGGDRARQDPVDVVDPANRRRAFATLFADELAARRGRIEAAAAGTSLKDALDLMPTLRELGAVELAATGQTETVADLSTGLDARIAAHMEGAAAALAKELEGHAAHASSSGTGANMLHMQRGLGSRAGRVAEIARLAHDMRGVCIAGEDVFTDTDRDFAGLRRRVERTRDLARRLLGHDFNRTYSTDGRNLLNKADGTRGLDRVAKPKGLGAPDRP